MQHKLSLVSFLGSNFDSGLSLLEELHVPAMIGGIVNANGGKRERAMHGTVSTRSMCWTALCLEFGILSLETWRVPSLEISMIMDGIQEWSQQPLSSEESA